MSEDDEAAREARAARLRSKIDRMTGHDEPKASGDAAEDAGEEGGTEDTSQPRAGESPREFIHRKMREEGEGDKP
ncbi:MAG: hypothetical protein QOF61_2637 [Acidobacteriota bacterium]|jgi:hypothetical protein|nr:hypothetical protein [Acidobacteriota bacterium]